MASDNMRYTVCKLLADHISANVPELVGKTLPMPADPDVDATCESAIVIPGDFSFEPSMSSDELTSNEDENFAVVDLGAWVGSVEIRILAHSAAEREKLEQKVLNLFVDGRRGQIVLQTQELKITEFVTTYQAPIAFDLGSNSWNEEMVFDKARYSFTTVKVIYPMLAAWGAYTIDQMISSLTEDLTTVIASDIPIESKAIDSDGVLTTP